MNILVILGHPVKESFNHAIAERCIMQLANNGHTIFFHDLYSEQFNPVQPATSNAVSDAEKVLIDKHTADLKRSDGIIIIHPNWWGQPPAIVKGWLDRVLVPGVAYNFTEGKNGETIPVGLLKATLALVINTSNTLDEHEAGIYKDTLGTLWKKRVFGFCGVCQCVRKNFAPVKNSTQVIRKHWLEDVGHLTNTCFPKSKSK